MMKEKGMIPSKKIQKYLNLGSSIVEQITVYGNGNMIFLDKNENPYGPPFSTLPSLNFRKLLATYPDPNCENLLSRLSEKLGYPISYLIAGAGSDELIDMIFRTFLDNEERVLSVNPTFSMYRKYAEINGATYFPFPLDLDLDRSTGIASYNLNKKGFLEQARISKILILARPNNPDGKIISKDFICQLLSLKKLTIIDEAYIEFSDESSVIDLITKYDNLIIIRTFSKSYALAGIRLGYAITNPSIVEILNQVKSPYNVNALASQYGTILISSSERFSKNILKIKETRKAFTNKLSEIREKTKQFYIHLSQGNFILMRFLTPKDSESFYQYLLKNQILIRKFEGQLRNCIRISIGTNEQMNKLLEIIKTYFEVN